MQKDSISFKIPAIRLFQRETEGKAIYVGVIKASDLSSHPQERFRIAYFDRENKNAGYQRRLQDNKVEKLKEFILKETKTPLFPTAILVNSREMLDFKEISKGVGTLHVNEPLFVIDGQHRVTAWRAIVDETDLADKWKDYEFPIVLMSGFKILEEMEQFYVINSRQTKIKTDLVHSLLLEFEKKDETRNLVKEKDKWIPRAVVITENLNKSGAWKDRIGYDSDSDLMRKTRVIQATSVVGALKHLFVGNKKLFDIENPKIDEWIKFLNDYWEIIADIYPNAVNNANDYSLMKTVGINVMHILLADKSYDLGLGIEQKEELLKKMRETLVRAAISDIPEDFWRSDVSKQTRERGRYAGAFSSSAGHKRLATAIFINRFD
ncbi:MAG: DGQHR domain-containing protein [Patescibacteria group bacterium]|nr:DGQHR domain-containing protein [Patescibacteria group bacterium]